MSARIAERALAALNTMTQNVGSADAAGIAYGEGHSLSRGEVEALADAAAALLGRLNAALVDAEPGLPAARAIAQAAA